MKTLTNTILIVVVATLCILVQSAGAVTFTQPVMIDIAEGVSIDTTGTNVAIGKSANGGNLGTAVGCLANGYSYGIAIGYAANGYYYGVALGNKANGCTNGAAVGREANGCLYGAAMGRGASGYNGAAVGFNANGDYGGAAVGVGANGSDAGAATGYRANGHYAGAAMGSGANGANGGAAMGQNANGYNCGAAMGLLANGIDGAAMGKNANAYNGGAAMGLLANGADEGAAMGIQANGYYSGAAVGSGANGANHGVALGTWANAGNGSAFDTRIAIGYNVNNTVSNSCRLRGDLYLDGASSTIRYRQTFGSGDWETKTFVIDHPLDPRNKILRHACLEGPKVQNVYNSTVVLNGKGEAVVTLPEYFEALNKNPQYTLTPLGAPMPNVHVNVEIRDNTFVIAGGVPGGKVCWEVKGERNDIAVRENPLVVEERKAVPGLVYRK